MRIVCDIDAAARASPCSAARCIDCDAACRAPAQRLMTDSYFACRSRPHRPPKPAAAPLPG